MSDELKTLIQSSRVRNTNDAHKSFLDLAEKLYGEGKSDGELIDIYNEYRQDRSSALMCTVGLIAFALTFAIGIPLHYTFNTPLFWYVLAVAYMPIAAGAFFVWRFWGRVRRNEGTYDVVRRLLKKRGYDYV